MLALAGSLTRRLRSLLKPDISTNERATLAVKVARDVGAGWSGLEWALNTILHVPEVISGLIKLRHCVCSWEVVLSRLLLEDGELKTLSVVLPWLTVDCQDAYFYHALVSYFVKSSLPNSI